jgi:ribose 5-phosphate isomerase
MSTEREKQVAAEAAAELDVTSIDRFDITIDGADQVAPDGWLAKGGGAHTREKIVAGAADRFVVIADSSKPVQALHAPIPLELMSFGLRATMRKVDPATPPRAHNQTCNGHSPRTPPGTPARWPARPGGS